MEPTHASFFSGVGGLDLGLERAGWRTVSFSEIDPYANAVLAERWPGVPNLGDIVRLAERGRSDQFDATDGPERDALTDTPTSRASLWSGGFPCQDLSVAGKRRGFSHATQSAQSGRDEGREFSGIPAADARTRSGLAFAFLDLVERHRPPAILLENVPGLLSSHRGRDFAALLDRLGQLGYWWAYRILDAQFFGVPQRRRRVFIVALNAERGFGPDSAAAVLSVGARCGGHSATGDEARTGVATGTGDGVELAGSLTRRYGKGINTTLDDGAAVIGPPPDPGGVRAPDGLAGGVDDRPHPSLRAGGHGSPGIGRDGDEGRLILSPTLRVGPARPQDGGPGDTVPITISPSLRARGNASHREDSEAYAMGQPGPDSDLLPLGLDSHRYRCCGNGVVSNVAEWIGERLRRAVEAVASLRLER